MTNVLNEKRKARKNAERYHLLDKVTMIEALIQRFGPPVLETIKEARAEMMQLLWKQVSENAKDNSIESLIDNLWSEEYFEYTKTEEKDGSTKMNVTWCVFADIARENNIQDIAFEILCVDDDHIVKGFNPNIDFKRTKTLMEGHECCNHCYRYKMQ